MGKCVASFVSTTESINGTIPELRGLPRVKVDGIKKFPEPKTTRHPKEHATPRIAGIWLFALSHCSTNIKTKSEVIANSIPVVLNVIATPTRPPMALPATQ